MKSDWLAFLTQAGAVFGETCVLHFGNPLQELRNAIQNDILCDLSHLGLIAAQGEDAQPFLQGQLTNDVTQVTPEHSQLSAYCNPKGRVLACFRLFQRGAVYYLRMPRERVDPILQRLGRFVLRAKVILEDASDTLVGVGLAGPNAEILLQRELGTAPSQSDQVCQTHELTVIRLPGTTQPRFEIHGEVAGVQKLWASLAGQVTYVGAEPWRLLDILTGIPTIYNETSEAFIPHMINLQLINGVSFRKGCYTGQEIVARTQYLGQIKRRMYRAHVESASPPRPGDELFSPQGADNESVGKIVDVCQHPEGGYELLAVVALAFAENGKAVLGENNRFPLAFRPLPYVFETGVI